MSGPGHRVDESEWVVSALRAAYLEARSKVRRLWSRDLPIDELLFDRWERASSLGFGRGSSIYHLSYVYGEVQVGENTWIGPFTLLDGTGGLSIGSFCSISSGVHIYTHDTVEWALSGGVAPYRRAPVRIEDNCYVGAQCVIGMGVTIGEHSVVGAGAFVNQDIPGFSVAVGTPARVIGRVRVSKTGTVQLEYGDFEST